ncbi:MAG: class I SAM-dependent methyltransferase [Archangium sp.]|nr:class I SAM-dependent methyltransferase [Archangium sp.]MDP3576122.1 class I SAM-dependent methyltransferase [Archangium sp.]
MNADWPELSDLLLDTDLDTLARKPVSRGAVRAVLRRHGMRTAERILDGIPGGEVLDAATVDGILVRAHCELQRLSYEFRNGQRLLQLLAPMLEVLRAKLPQRPLRIVDIGCGMGFVLRWLAAYGALGDDVELLGCDFNPTLIANAEKLAREEGLRCKFRVANAFTLEQQAHVFLSTGVIHHFRGEALTGFFRSQASVGAAAMLHCDIKASWAAPLGSWIFHQARMREPLARHDGVLSAVRAHPCEVLLSASREGGSPLRFALFDGKPSLLPILRTMNTLVGVRAEFAEPFRERLGPLSARLEPFS